MYPHNSPPAPPLDEDQLAAEVAKLGWQLSACGPDVITSERVLEDGRRDRQSTSVDGRARSHLRALAARNATLLDTPVGQGTVVQVQDGVQTSVRVGGKSNAQVRQETMDWLRERRELNDREERRAAAIREGN